VVGGLIHVKQDWLRRRNYGNLQTRSEVMMGSRIYLGEANDDTALYMHYIYLPLVQLCWCRFAQLYIHWLLGVLLVMEILVRLFRSSSFVCSTVIL
jgi:hypothetical protein